MKTVLLLGLCLWSAGVWGQQKKYYLGGNGDDRSDGSRRAPWRTLERLSRSALRGGDSVFLAAGQTFSGTLRIGGAQSGSAGRPIVITSYGNGHAVINSGDHPGLLLDSCRYIVLRGLDIQGSGRKDGNIHNGAAISHARYIVAEDMVIKGYQKSGMLVFFSANVQLRRIFASDNGFAGISISGQQSKADCHDIYVGYCKASNNPGDPTVFNNHSGNGIIAGFCRKVVIEHCEATGNGWDMPRTGNGPVGIWAYEADSVIIQHCISYRNRTSKGGADGGGFDLDGGMTHSTIRFCLSYENEGSGYGIFQYAGASPWYDNAIHNCVSNNDGLVSAARAGIFIWNSSRDSLQFRNCRIHDNIIYNGQGAAIHYDGESEHRGFSFYNNQFVSGDTLIKGRAYPGDVFRNNHWTGVLPEGVFH